MTKSSTQGEVPATVRRPGQSEGEWVGAWRRSDALDALRRLLSASGQVAPALARRTGLTHTELAVLEHVIEDPVGPTELAHRLGVTSAAASGIVDRLVARGHVERQPHPSDRRRTVVEATPTGREEVVGHMMPMFRELAELDAAFTDEELAVVLRYLEGATQAVRRLL